VGVSFEGLHVGERVCSALYAFANACALSGGGQPYLNTFPALLPVPELDGHIITSCKH